MQTPTQKIEGSDFANRKHSSSKTQTSKMKAQMRQFMLHAAQHAMDEIMNDDFAQSGTVCYTLEPRECWSKHEWISTATETMDNFIEALNDDAEGVEYDWYWDENGAGTEFTIEYEVSVDWGKYDKPKGQYKPNAEKWVAAEWDDEDTWENDHLCLDLNHGYCLKEGQHPQTNDADWALFMEAITADGYTEDMYMRLKARLKERDGA